MTENDQESETGPAWELARALKSFGEADDSSALEELRPAYAAAEAATTERERLDVLIAVIGAAERQHIRGDALLPFLLFDGSPSVISTAALHSVPVWPGVSDESPLRGVEELLRLADIAVEQGDEPRAVAIVSGMLLLGDRRVAQALRNVQRHFTAAGQTLLARLGGVAAYATVIDWLIDWLEDCERNEFGSVAGALSRFSDQARKDGVIETRRALPIWSRPLEEASIHVGEWTFEEFAKRIRPRLLQIAADEAAPRIMHDVLKAWGISHTNRWVTGIHRRPAVSDASQRPLLPQLPPGTSTGELFEPIELKDADFVARDGTILIGWAIFNPNGPTFSCVGLLPTEDPEVDLLFYRMLNPFMQSSCTFAALRGSECDSGEMLERLLAPLFGRNHIGAENWSYPLFGGLPTVAFVVGSDEARDAIAGWFWSNVALAEEDFVTASWRMRAFPLSPWERVGAERDEALASMTDDGLLAIPRTGGPATPEEFTDWWSLVTSADTLYSEFYCIPGAWFGAIDHAPGALGASDDYTFWQLDDFVARYGVTLFRNLAATADGEADS